MTVPLLGQQPNGVCVVCKGALTPDHRHSYVDDAFMSYVNAIVEAMIFNRCLLVTTDGTFIQGHPRLREGFVWQPVPVTHAGPHDDCTATVPHHHCEVSADVESSTD